MHIAGGGALRCSARLLISCGASQGGAAAAALGLHKTTPPPRVHPSPSHGRAPASLFRSPCADATPQQHPSLSPSRPHLTIGTFQLDQVSVLHHLIGGPFWNNMSSVRSGHWRSPAKHTTPLVSSKVLVTCLLGQNGRGRTPKVGGGTPPFEKRLEVAGGSGAFPLFRLSVLGAGG